MKIKQPVILVSACLVGLCTRYDGKLKKNSNCLQQLHQAVWIPVCPEQLGGLPTPREAADIHGGDGRDVLRSRARVLTRNGGDVTSAFISGARQVLQIAQLQNVQKAYLKARSPSCALHGTMGVTAALLMEHGIEIVEF